MRASPPLSFSRMERSFLERALFLLRLFPFSSMSSSAPVGQALTHAGFPRQRSHGSGSDRRPLRWSTSKGHESTQLAHAEHRDCSTETGPKGPFLERASPGQTAMQGASAHSQQRRGTWQEKSGSPSVMRRAEKWGSPAPARCARHAISHCPHPVHFSAWTRIEDRARSVFFARREDFIGQKDSTDSIVNKGKHPVQT